MYWMIYVWLGVALVAMTVEFITTKMYAIWLIGGALVAMLLCALSVAWYIQLPVFAVVSAALVIFARKPSVKLIEKRIEKQKEERKNEQVQNQEQSNQEEK